MNENFPLKIIIQRQEDNAKNKAGGSKNIFDDFSVEKVNNLKNKVLEIKTRLDSFFENHANLPVVCKVTMRPEAIAKSHRPSDLLKYVKVIGAGDIGTLFVRIDKDSINRTINRFDDYTINESVKANISAIDDIQLYDFNDVVRVNDESIHKNVKVMLFNFNNEEDDENNFEYFKSEIEKLGLRIDNIRTYGLLEYFEFHEINNDTINQMSNIFNIKSIVDEDYFVESFETNPIGTKFVPSLDNYEITDTYIGIIDSGIFENSIVNSYVVSREVYVAPEYQNRKHGTFVASTILFGDEMNNRIVQSNKLFKLIDVIAIPNGDKDYGLTDSLSDSDFYDIIEKVMVKYSAYVKIWNLSLGIENIIARNDGISAAGGFCDYIQQKYGVQFIISSGNKNSSPLRTYPSNITDDSDRICSPADSGAAISVGAIAEYEDDNSIVKVNQPSPFSRRGPGANYMIKPELTDFGGNVGILNDAYYITNLGEKGLGENDILFENIGTSFSAPLITRKFATIFDELVDKDINLCKALLIHNAKKDGIKLYDDASEHRYFGFGQPEFSPQNVLNTNENEITLIFKYTIFPGNHIEMKNFPYPDSLRRNGKYFGEITMTLVSEADFDINYGSEYCRINFEIGFGIDSPKGFSSEVPLERNWDEKYEKSMIENGFKWNPIKVYHRKIKTGINDTGDWKLRIDMVQRAEEQRKPKTFVLLLTIKGDEYSSVYNDVVNQMKEQAYNTIDLQTKNSIKTRIR